VRKALVSSINLASISILCFIFYKADFNKAIPDNFYWLAFILWILAFLKDEIKESSE
jgi:hypothetical protein